MNLFIYLFVERGEGREALMWEGNIHGLHLICTPARDQIHHPVMCPEKELNQRPFALRYPATWAASVRAMNRFFLALWNVSAISIDTACLKIIFSDTTLATAAFFFLLHIRFKVHILCPGQVAQLVRVSSVYKKGLRVRSLGRAWTGGTYQCFSLTLMFLSLSLPSSLSKISKHILGWGLKLK